jgi:hypothetical protein
MTRRGCFAGAAAGARRDRRRICERRAMTTGIRTTGRSLRKFNFEDGISCCQISRWGQSASRLRIPTINMRVRYAENLLAFIVVGWSMSIQCWRLGALRIAGSAF